MNEVYAIITLKQPWASWVMWMWKTIETREHQFFNNLGAQRIGIHAAKTVDVSDIALKNPYLTEELLARSVNLPTGCILGTVYCQRAGVRLNNSHEKQALIECDTRRYGLFVNKAIELPEPIKINGELGVWYYDFTTGTKLLKRPQPTTPLFN